MTESVVFFAGMWTNSRDLYMSNTETGGLMCSVRLVKQEPLLLQLGSELRSLCEFKNSGAIVCCNWNGVESGVGEWSVAVHSIGRWLCESCNSPNWIWATVHPLLGSLAPMVLRSSAPGGGARCLAAVHRLAKEEEGIRRHEREWRLQTRMKGLDLWRKYNSVKVTLYYNYKIWWNIKLIVILMDVMK